MRADSWLAFIGRRWLVGTVVFAIVLVISAAVAYRDYRGRGWVASAQIFVSEATLKPHVSGAYAPSAYETDAGLIAQDLSQLLDSQLASIEARRFLTAQGR